MIRPRHITELPSRARGIRRPTVTETGRPRLPRTKSGSSHTARRKRRRARRH